MRRILYILRHMAHLIRAHKLYFITPICIVLAILAFLVYYIGPAVIISFIYAGV